MEKHLQLGVCYYPEHWDSSKWQGYAQQMKNIGLSYVRIAEFAWSRMESQEGVYTWQWLDDAIEILASEGLKVVLCTPTATPPAWLIRKHPEILAKDKDGRIRDFGSRRHYDFASAIYREHSRRITTVLVQRYGQHPAVVGWQTDNEFGCHDTSRSYGEASVQAFRTWLQDKYSDLDSLNYAWGNVFWSMEYTDWQQINPPNLTVTEPNPSHVLDYYRFSSDMIAEFQAEQVAILRQFAPEQFVTHNFMIFESGFDHYKVAQGLDFVSWDSYPTGMLEFFAGWKAEELKHRYARTGHPDLISLNHDIYRGLLDKPFWVMEQQCGQVNWAPYNPLPADGAVQLWTAQAWAHGADVVSYFRWRAATVAQELMHSGLLRHDETPDRGYVEAQNLPQELFGTARLPVAKVALLHDYESLWIYDQQKHNASLNYWLQLGTYYTLLRSLGVDVDIVHPEHDLSPYAVVVAPAITIMDDRRAKHLIAASQHAKIVLGPRTAYRTQSGRTWEEGQFGILSEALGGKLLNFDSLRPSITEYVDEHPVTLWAEAYRVTDGECLKQYASGVLQGECAVLAKGDFITIGAHSPSLIHEILQQVLHTAGIENISCPEGVRISRRDGKTCVFNFNPEPVEFLGRTLAPVSFTFVTLDED